MKAALEGLSDDEVFAEIQARHRAATEPDKSVKQAELETLATSRETIGDDTPDGVFFARSLPKGHWDRPWMQPSSGVVLVHRLREVVGQVGFTRFEAAGPTSRGIRDGRPPCLPGARDDLAAGRREPGRGVFLQFNTRGAVEAWLARARRAGAGASAARWVRVLEAGAPGHPSAISRPALPHAPLVCTSAHHGGVAGVRLPGQLDPRADLRRPGVGYGVLLYTGTSDAEGTLGGLIQVGRRIHEHVRTALELGELCSNDPVCAQHDPRTPTNAASCTARRATAAC